MNSPVLRDSLANMVLSPFLKNKSGNSFCTAPLCSHIHLEGLLLFLFCHIRQDAFDLVTDAVKRFILFIAENNFILQCGAALIDGFKLLVGE